MTTPAIDEVTDETIIEIDDCSDFRVTVPLENLVVASGGFAQIAMERRVLSHDACAGFVCSPS